MAAQTRKGYATRPWSRARVGMFVGNKFKIRRADHVGLSRRFGLLSSGKARALDSRRARGSTVDPCYPVASSLLAREGNKECGLGTMGNGQKIPLRRRKAARGIAVKAGAGKILPVSKLGDPELGCWAG